MTIRIYCLLIIGVLVGQRVTGFSIKRHIKAIVPRNNNTNVSRQIIDHQLGNSRSKAANSFPSFKMMSTTDDDDGTVLSTSDELSRPSASPQTFSKMIEDNTDVNKTTNWKRVSKTLSLGQTT